MKTESTFGDVDSVFCVSNRSHCISWSAFFSFSVCENLCDKVFSNRSCNRHTLIAADDHGIDANDFTLGIDQRSTGVARSQRCVGTDHRQCFATRWRNGLCLRSSVGAAQYRHARNRQRAGLCPKSPWGGPARGPIGCPAGAWQLGWTFGQCKG